MKLRMTKYYDGMGRDVTAEVENIISQLSMVQTEAERWHQKYDALRKRREAIAKPDATEEVNANGN
jgi:hypothetical protein